MKLSISEQTARKALDLIPESVGDQDLKQLRERIQKGLAAVTAAGHLTADELEALLWAAIQMEEKLEPYQDDQGSRFLIAKRTQLGTAIPKLTALRDRAVADARGDV